MAHLNNQSRHLAQELVEKEIFNVQERRTELRRQAPVSSKPEDLYGEVRRLERRLMELRKLERDIGITHDAAIDRASSLSSHPEEPGQPRKRIRRTRTK